MKRVNSIKIEYVLLVLAYAFIFVFMPSVHCHIQFLDYGPHCFHCHGHIELPSPTDDDNCDFCPVINFNTVNVPVLYVLALLCLYVAGKVSAKENSYIFLFTDRKPSRAPPAFFVKKLILL